MGRNRYPVPNIASPNANQSARVTNELPCPTGSSPNVMNAQNNVNTAVADSIFSNRFQNCGVRLAIFTSPLLTSNRIYKDGKTTIASNRNGAQSNQNIRLWITRHAQNREMPHQIKNSISVSPKNAPFSGSSQKKILRSNRFIIFRPIPLATKTLHLSCDATYSQHHYLIRMKKRMSSKARSALGPGLKTCMAFTVRFS